MNTADCRYKKSSIRRLSFLAKQPCRVSGRSPDQEFLWWPPRVAVQQNISCPRIGSLVPAPVCRQPSAGAHSFPTKQGNVQVRIPDSARDDLRHNRHQERADIITYRMARYVKNHVTNAATFWRTDGKKISVPVPQPDGRTAAPETGTRCRRAAQNIGAWRGSGQNYGTSSGTGCVIV